MRIIPTLFTITLAACKITIFNGGGGDDTRTTSHPDGGPHGSGDYEPDGGIYGVDAGIYYGADGGCSLPVDAGYYGFDAGCPNGFGSGGSGTTCIE
jgi:hypothetical protein